MQMSYPLDKTYYDASYPRLYQATRTSGVYSAESHFLTTVSGGMTINVSSGLMWLKLSEFQGCVFASTESEQFLLDNADGQYNRKDSLIVRYDAIGSPNEDGVMVPEIYLTVKKGENTAQTDPQPPLLQRDENVMEWALADIRVPKGVTQITPAYIEDQRLNEEVCGVMRDGVTGIPTQSLYDAWWDWFSSLKLDAETKASEFSNWIDLFKANQTSDFNAWFSSFKTSKESEFYKWFDSIKDTLNEDALTNLYKKIEDVEDRIDSIEERVNNINSYQQTLVVGHVNSGHTKDDVDYLCTGTSDNLTIEKAMSALPSEGGKILLREGTYNLSARVYLNKANVTIEGMGDETIINKAYNGYAFAIYAKSCVVSNLYIEGNKTAESPTSNNAAFYLSELSSGATLYQVTANNHGGAGVLVGDADISIVKCKFSNNGNDVDAGSGITFNANTDIVRSRILIYKCECIDNKLYGIRMNNYAENCTISGCTISGHTYGIYITASGRDNMIARNLFEDNEYGVYCAGPDNSFVRNTCDGNNRSIYITANNNLISGNKCNNSTQYGSGIELYSGNYNIVSNNLCDGNYNAGIYVRTNARQNTITGNTCSNGSSGIAVQGGRNTLVGNVLQGNYVSGIGITGNLNTITGNSTYSTGVGIYIYDSSEYNTAIANSCIESAIQASGVGCNITGNTCHGINLSSTSSGCLVSSNLTTLENGITNAGTDNTVINNR